MFEIQTLGSAWVRNDGTGEAAAVGHQPKCLGCLAYLALEPSPLLRGRLHAMFWPELREDRAAAALRQLVYRLRRSLGPETLRDDGRSGLRLSAEHVRCDAATFRDASRNGRMHQAVQLYRGEFLPGFHVPGAPEFERWVDRQRRELADLAARAGWQLATEAETDGDLALAQQWSEWALSLSPYDEDRLRKYLLLLSRIGETEKARAVYERFAEQLRAELDLAPSPATQRLADRFRDARGIPARTRPDAWSALHARALEMSGRTATAVIRTSGIPFALTITRACFRDHLELFLRSDRVATAFVAPAGYGKSVGLAQAVEALWLGPAAAYPEDVVWYVQTRSLGALHEPESGLAGWLLERLGFGADGDYRTYFTEHPEARRGRMVLVLDGLDEHALGTAELDAFFGEVIELIASIREPWLKVVLSLRTTAWHRFAALVRDAPAFRELWYGVQFGSWSEDPRNVPPLEPHEIRTVLERAWSGRELPGWERAALEASALLAHPFFLQLFVQTMPAPLPAGRPELVEQYLQRRIATSPGAAELLLADIVRETDFGQSRRVPLSRLAPVIERHAVAYRQLLADNVLREEQELDEQGGTRVMVGVQPVLFEAVIAREWIARAGGCVTTSLLEEVAAHYTGSALRFPVLAWLVQHALHAGETDALTGVFRLSLTGPERRQLARNLGFALRHADSARELLLPRWAADRAGRAGYFEYFVDQDYIVLQFSRSLQHYLRHNRSREAQVYGHSMLLLGHLLRLGDAGCRQEAARLRALTPDASCHPLPLGRALGYLLLYHHFLEGTTPPALQRAIRRHALLTPRRDDAFAAFPAYHVTVMEALNLCGRFRQSLRVMDAAVQQYPAFEQYHDRTIFYRMLLVHHAMALLMTGRHHDAAELARKLEAEPLPPDPHTYPTFHYGRLHELLLQAELRVQAGTTQQATAPLESAIEVSRMLHFRFFEARALARLAELYAENDRLDEVATCRLAFRRVLGRSAFRISFPPVPAG